jgi:hypothetical protein
VNGPQAGELPGARQGGHRLNPRGNERLTAMTGAVLLVLFTAEVVTTLLMGSLMDLHFFLGMLLIGPVCLKIGSTLWRFARYYTGSEPYVRRGPPAKLQRVLGPFLILTSTAVLGSGVMLAMTGPGSSWGRIHQLSFYLWLIIVIIHVIAYAPKLPRLLASRPAGRILGLVAGGTTRWLLLGGSLAAGLIIALLTYHLEARWNGFFGSSIL